MIDFLFITSPTNARNPHPPYYFMALAAYLREKGLKVQIIDPKGGDIPKDIEKYIDLIRFSLKMTKARFVGLAAFHPDYSMVMRLGKLIKEIQPDTTLLVGNAHATINPEDFIYEGSPFDIAVLGEGEETCWRLWEQKRDVKDDYWPLGNVKGIAYAEQNEGDYPATYHLVKTKPRPFMDLHNLPMPAYDLVDMGYYLKPQKLVIRRIYTSMMPIFAGRGCPYAGNSCDFCAANAVWKANTGKAARLRPVKNVIDEIWHLWVYYKIDFFYMFDDTFGMSKEWMKEWFDCYQSFGLNIPYACQTRANLIDEEMIKGLKETGCIQIDIGVETCSQSLLDRIHKQITVQQVQQAVTLCRKYQLRYFFTMLLNLPGETTTDLQMTYNGLKKLKPNGVIFGITTPYPGTKIYSDHCHPALRRDEYSLLIGNRLDPIERFRMAEHKLNLERLWDKWNRHFRSTPMLERMWPSQPLYWKALLKSKRKKQYIWCWLKDLPKTFIIYWLHVLRLYRPLKGLGHRKEEKACLAPCLTPKKEDLRRI